MGRSDDIGHCSEKVDGFGKSMRLFEEETVVNLDL